MLQPTGYHALMLTLGNELVNHGWGKMTVTVESLKDRDVKVVIDCGKSHVFFIKKNIVFNPDQIL
jgi:hypothetical protein